MEDEPAARQGPNYALWIIVGIIVLMVGGMAVTIGISVSAGVSDGFIPVEERD